MRWIRLGASLYDWSGIQLQKNVWYSEDQLTEMHLNIDTVLKWTKTKGVAIEITSNEKYVSEIKQNNIT